MATLHQHQGEVKVRISHELSEGEKLGTSNRKARVKKCLDSFGIPCNLEDVPNIAILGAGGGLRAMIALHGTLQELQKHGLLDTIMYLCGVSGATWCMSSLYNNGDWAEKLQALEKHMCDALTKSTWDFRKAKEMLCKVSKDENYSLTDFWAYMVIYGMLHELDKGHLSEQRGAAENGNNPYPIYAAVEEQTYCKLTEYSPETWFEFTPHEASFLGCAASVPMEYFGSEFNNGVLKKQKEEKNMTYLQGLWGSCLGSKEKNFTFMDDIFSKFFKGKRGSHSLSTVANESTMESSMAEEIVCDAGTMESPTAENIVSSTGTMESSMIGEIVCYAGLAMDLARVMTKTAIDLQNWKWGTNCNFTYKCAALNSPELVTKEVISLVDAGIAINCAYPLVLRPERKVKLILSFDYGPFDPFQTLKQAAKYCEENHIPFPKVDEKLLEDPNNPSDCYIFRGEGAPTVMHFPLFNKVNCSGCVKKWRLDFKTIYWQYNEEDVHKLLQAVKLNVSNNKDKILQEIKHIVALCSMKFFFQFPWVQGTNMNMQTQIVLV